MTLDVLIVGAGPAGLTAALYAGRSKLTTQIAERFAAGGQVLLTETIENFPGIYRMNSCEWVEMMKKQLTDLKDVELGEEARVEHIEAAGGLFKARLVSSIDGAVSCLEARCVIIATGARPRKLGLSGEEALTGKGVSYCATCDGPLFRDKEVVLVGGGDTALEEALYLRKFARRVTILHRRDSLRATALLQERARADEKIRFMLEAVPVEIVGKKSVEAVRVRNVRTGQEEALSCDGVFIFVGFTPDTAFLKGLLDLNEAGYIITDESMMSSCTGVFAAGDCRARPLKQVVTACSDGAIAAYSVTKFLENTI